MQYHAISLLKSFPTLKVTLIGYEGENLFPELKDYSDDRCTVSRIDVSRGFLDRLVRKCSFQFSLNMSYSFNFRNSSEKYT